MTSVLPRERGGKEMEGREESRAFLSFSRENLSMLTRTDMAKKQYPMKSRLWIRPSCPTILAVVSFVLALLSLSLVICLLQYSIDNTQEMKKLRREIDFLKSRVLTNDVTNALKAFDRVLNMKEPSSEVDTDDTDYESNYEDEEEEEESALQDYDDYQLPSSYRYKPSEAVNPEGVIISGSADPTKGLKLQNPQLDEALAILRNNQKSQDPNDKKAPNKQGEKSSEDNRKENFEKSSEPSTEGPVKGRTKFKRDARDNTGSKLISTPESSVQLSLDDYNEEFGSVYNDNDQSSIQVQENRKKWRIRSGLVAPTSESYEDVEYERTMSEDQESSSSWNHSQRHPPKKYLNRSRSVPLPLARGTGQSLKEITTPRESTRKILNSKESHRRGPRLFQNRSMILERTSDKKELLHHGVTRRHLRAPRQIYAAHYGADSTLFTNDDEHTGNGRARHNEGVFKAWRPSDWVSDLGMQRHFSIKPDGRLTVHEAGIYLVYAQIHYLDEHDENGFHLLVNGRPIMQCMVYSPGTGHKSRSCFSAQVTALHAGDKLVLKDVGPARYTLFQHDKSFFGLAKLGEQRQSQRLHSSTTQAPL
ncbi:uncharacterized protein egr [Prorops nasuta]|uniref:uncharacterized protein egr n=1 Tax=Prorops nasuta TaxID=863751 RepID=UPI0034CD5060